MCVRRLLRCGVQQRSRKEAIATNTDIVVVKDGRLLVIEATTLRQQAQTGNVPTP